MMNSAISDRRRPGSRPALRIASFASMVNGLACLFQLDGYAQLCPHSVVPPLLNVHQVIGGAQRFCQTSAHLRGHSDPNRHT